MIFALRPLFCGRFKALLATALVLLCVLRPALGQGQLVSDRFATAPEIIDDPVVFSHDGTTELCFASEEISEDGDDELFCYDGNSLRQVTSISRYGGGANLEDLTVYDSGSGPKLYFGAWNGKDRDGIWSYDGTDVKFEASIDGSDDADPTDFAVYDDGSGARLYFSASDGSNGQELWSFDGSSITLEADINGSGSSDPSDLTVYDGGSDAKLYFRATNGSSGQELWSYDGTDVTAEADINGSGSSDPTGLTIYNDGGGAKLYFGANNGSSGQELWSYDGSNAALEADINDSGESNPREFIVYDDGNGAKLYFGATNGSSGRELWSYDGSSPTLEADINDSGDSNPGELIVYDDGNGAKLFFGAADGSGGQELWSFDGTGTTVEAELNGSDDLSPSDFAVFDDGSGSTLYFSADPHGEYNVFYKHSATGTGPVSVTESPREGPSEKVVYNGNLYFEGNGEGDGEELWVYDGSSISQVEDIRPGPRGSQPSDFTVYAGDLYFSANNGSDGRELWIYDGSTVSQVRDLYSGSEGSDPSGLTVYDDGNGAKLYFEARDGDFGYELWSADGSNMQLEDDILSGAGSSLPSDLAVYDEGSGKKLFFRAQGSSGFGLWSFGGSDSKKEADISPEGLTVYNSKLYFSAEGDNGNGQELWSFDETDATLEADIDDGSANSYPQGLTVYDDGNGAKLYFGAFVDGGEGLWSYDGSNAESLDLISSSVDSDPSNLSVFAGHLYFTALTPEDGVESRTYDGTEMKTVDLNTGASSGGGDAPVVYDDGTGEKLYVTATDGQSGAELYEFSPQSSFLPVELSAFEATQTDRNEVELTWTTASESGNAGFRVQHQAEVGGSWQKIGFVDGHGTTTEAQTYCFTAGDLSVGTHRFRLEQVDTDGTTHLQDAVSVKLKMQNALQLTSPAPNPLRRQAKMTFAVRDKQAVRIAVYNVLGQRVETLHRGSVPAGESQTVSISAGDLASGTYFVRIQAGERIVTRQLTVVQ